MTDPRALPILTASVLGNFAVVQVLRRGLGNVARRCLSGIAIVANLALLVSFRWLQEQAGVSLPAALTAGGSAGVGVPLGLAFYTLQQISYLVDAQRPGAVHLSLPRYAAWIASFVQLPAGPIGTYRTMAEQYAVLGRRAPSTETIARGATLFLAGVVKKIWIADSVAMQVDTIFASTATGAVSFATGWSAAFGFLVQLYFDFSSYSDMAVGLALCFGIVLPINFNSPLKAVSPGDYVMRWHISLTMFVRTYVFEPAFQAARRLPVRPTPRRYLVAWALATMAAFVAVGLWHSLTPATLAAALALGGVMVVVQNARLRWRARSTPRSAVAIWSTTTASRLLLLIAASTFALFLRADSQDTALKLLNAMTANLFAASAGAGEVAEPFHLPRHIVAASIIALIAPNTMQIFGIVGGTTSRWRLWYPNLLGGVVTGVLLILALIGLADLNPPRDFIYARL